MHPNTLAPHNSWHPFPGTHFLTPITWHPFLAPIPVTVTHPSGSEMPGQAGLERHRVPFLPGSEPGPRLLTSMAR